MQVESDDIDVSMCACVKGEHSDWSSLHTVTLALAPRRGCQKYQSLPVLYL